MGHYEAMGNELTRRKFLLASAAGTAAVTAAAGCSDDDPANGANSSTSTVDKAAARSLRDIEHVVILIQENRSFDHYFGTRPGVTGFGDTAALTRADGRSVFYQDSEAHPDGYVLPFPLRPTETSDGCSIDPPHTWIPQHIYYDQGKMGGFARLGAINLGYYTRDDLEYYWSLADAFTLCDHYFCSVIGSTTPNRLYAWTASIDPDGQGGGPVYENLTGPFHWETYPERLQRAGVSWRVYHEADDFDDNSLKFFAAYQGLAETDPLHDAAMRNRDAGAFAADVAAGDLPQVTWIVAPAALSEHPGLGSPFPGIDYSARHLAALMANPDVWAKTVFVLTYDENGGWFDHVAPPVAPPGTPGEYVNGYPIGMGFRVPTIVASPYSRGGRVVDTVFDHTSVLRLLETRFGVEIPNISAWRRETAGDLADLLDFSKPDLSVPKLPDTSDGPARQAACAALPKVGPPATQAMPMVS